MRRASLPSDLVGKLDREVLPSGAAATTLAAREARRCSRAASRSKIELELTGERGPRWFDVTRPSALRARAG